MRAGDGFLLITTFWAVTVLMTEHYGWLGGVSMLFVFIASWIINYKTRTIDGR